MVNRVLMSPVDEQCGVYDPQAHVHAIAEDEADRAEPSGEQVRCAQERDRLVDHDQVTLVYGRAVGRCVSVTLGHAINSQQ